MHRNQNFEMVFERESDLCLKAFQFLEFYFHLSFFVFAAVIDLLLGLLAVKKLLRKRHRDWQFLAWSTAGNFAPSFSLNFLSIFVHISGSIRPITLIWHHWKDLFLLQKLSKDDANFGQNR